MDDRVSYNRLVTIDSNHLIQDTFTDDPNPSYTNIYLDDYAKRLLTSELHLDTSENKRLMEGGRLRVGYWIE